MKIYFVFVGPEFHRCFFLSFIDKGFTVRHLIKFIYRLKNVSDKSQLSDMVDSQVKSKICKIKLIEAN